MATLPVGTDTVRRFRTRFRDLVWRGDTLTTAIGVPGVREEAGEQRVELDLCLRTDRGVIAVDGSAEFVVGAA